MAGTILDARLIPMGNKRMTSLATAILLSTVTIPTGADRVLVQAESDAIRWTDDGDTTVTTTLGQRLEDGADFMYVGDLTQLQFIRLGTSAQINLSFYRGGVPA